MYLNPNRMTSLVLIAVVVSAVSPAAFSQKVIVSHQRSLMPPADEARDIFNAGTGFYDEDKFVEAERRFREVVSRFPTNVIADRADYYLIRTLNQMGRKIEALARVNSFARQYPKSKYQDDVQEIRLRLTNQVPPNAEFILLPQPPAPPNPPGTAKVSTQAAPAPAPTPNPFAFVMPPMPPVPPMPAMPAMPAMPFGPIGGFQSSDPEISLQQEIMRAMFQNNADRALEIATERLKSNPADPVVLSSLNMVANSRSAQAVPMLLAIARNSTNSRARRDAIYWLGQSRGDKDSIVDMLVGLIPSLADDDSEAVAFALSQIRSDKSVNALASIARDKNKSEKSRNNALFWIGQSRAANRVSLLEDIYKSSMDNSKIRSQILYALNQTREPQAVTVLGNIASGDPDLNVRKQAVFWLGQNKTPEANQALERLLQRK
jgi:HEAT repeat protein